MHCLFIVIATLVLPIAACDDPQEPPAATVASGTTVATEEAPEPAPEDEQADDRPAPTAREHETTEEARLGHAPDGFGLEIGSDAPEGSAVDADGDEVTLASLLENGPIMIVFYRGGWCPFCNFQVRALTESFDALQSRGVTPVLVSVDRQDEATRTRATYEIPFPILSDSGLALHRAFHVVHEADDEEVARLAGFGHDVEAFSGRDHHSFAIPSVFVIDGDGKVRWQHVDPEYRVRPSVDQLLAILDELALSEEPR